MHAIFFEPPLENNYIGHQISEIYKDKTYDHYLIGKKDLTIIDIGASGITSYYFSQFAKQVYALEPAKEHFDILTKMLDFNKITNVKPINKAIYMDSGKFTLYHNPNKTMYSLHAAVNDGSGKEEQIDAITLEDLFNEEKIEHCDFMKIDVEGSEYEIFGGTSFAAVAPKIDVIVGESHKWAGRNENQLKESLKNNGFDFKWLNTEAQLFVATK